MRLDTVPKNYLKLWFQVFVRLLCLMPFQMGNSAARIRNDFVFVKKYDLEHSTRYWQKTRQFSDRWLAAEPILNRKKICLKLIVRVISITHEKSCISILKFPIFGYMTGENWIHVSHWATKVLIHCIFQLDGNFSFNSHFFRFWFEPVNVIWFQNVRN